MIEMPVTKNVIKVYIEMYETNLSNKLYYFV